MELKDRLKYARKEATKTQAQVADAVGIAQPTYQQLESGKSQASAFLPQIASYLGVDALWLATGAGAMKPAADQTTSPEQSSAPPEDPPLIQWPDIQGHLAGVQTQVIKRCKVNTAAYGPRTFWVPVRDNAMVGGMLFIPQGHRIAVDPDRNWRARLLAGSQTFILAQLQAEEEPVFRRLSREGGQLWLVAADPRYPLLGPIQAQDVVGMVLEAVMDL